MQLGFVTENLQRAEAALILYAAYRSRGKNSSLNGLETWNRFSSYIRGACLKSETTAQFVSTLCKMADIGSIKPYYLTTDGGMLLMRDGSIIQSTDVEEYKIDIMEDDSLMSIFEGESQLLVMLVRERIQREKMEVSEDEENEYLDD